MHRITFLSVPNMRVSIWLFVPYLNVHDLLRAAREFQHFFLVQQLVHIDIVVTSNHTIGK